MSTTAPNDITPVVSVTEEIAAEPSTVFESLVDPAALAEWMRAPNDVGTHDWSVDLQPGGAWSVTVDEPDGTTRTLGGVFVEVDAPNRLAFTWRDSDDASAAGVVRYTLEEIAADGEIWTRLTVTHAMSARPLGMVSVMPEYWCAVCASLARFVGESRFAITA